MARSLGNTLQGDTTWSMWHNIWHNSGRHLLDHPSVQLARGSAGVVIRWRRVDNRTNRCLDPEEPNHSYRELPISDSLQA